jgi:hypothetical protein
MNIEVSNPELDGDVQAVNEGLVFSYIIGGSESGVRSRSGCVLRGVR